MTCRCEPLSVDTVQLATIWLASVSSSSGQPKLNVLPAGGRAVTLTVAVVCGSFAAGAVSPEVCGAKKVTWSVPRLRLFVSEQLALPKLSAAVQETALVVAS